jgi:hypothetical protein
MNARSVYLLSDSLNEAQGRGTVQSAMSGPSAGTFCLISIKSGFLLCQPLRRPLIFCGGSLACCCPGRATRTSSQALYQDAYLDCLDSLRRMVYFPVPEVDPAGRGRRI